MVAQILYNEPTALGEALADALADNPKQAKPLATPELVNHQTCWVPKSPSPQLPNWLVNHCALALQGAGRFTRGELLTAMAAAWRESYHAWQRDHLGHTTAPGGERFTRRYVAHENRQQRRHLASA